jgi:hypothetical protein
LVSKFVNLKVKVPLHIGTKLKLEDEEEDTNSMAYGLEMSSSEFSSLDSVSLGSSWTSSLVFDRPPRYSEYSETRKMHFYFYYFDLLTKICFHFSAPPRYWETMTGSQASLNI